MKYMNKDSKVTIFTMILLVYFALYFIVCLLTALS